MSDKMEAKGKTFHMAHLFIFFKEKTSYPLQRLNAYFPNKQALYEYLTVRKGYYLPDFANNKCVTEAYLLKVLKNQVFTIPNVQIHPARLMGKAKKIELFNAINEQVEADLGFDEDTLADKQWLINVLKSLAPNHQFFKHSEAEVMRDFQEEYLDFFLFFLFILLSRLS